MRKAPYGRVIFSLFSKGDKRDGIVGYVCIHNFFYNDSKKSAVCSRHKKPQTVNACVGIMNASIVLFCLSLISNSLPTNEDICSSVIITWSVCYSACAKVLCFTITNKHGRSTEANVMSSTPHGFLWKNSVSSAKKTWRKWSEKAKQAEIFMMLGLLKWIRRENS